LQRRAPAPILTAMTTSTTDLADRYVALWNEPDPDRRRTMVRERWCADAVQVLDPPEEIRERAAELGFPRTTLEARGHAALEMRIARAYESFVAPGAFVFRREFLILDAEDRIRSDHQFIDR
jgi:hypothetical protein